MSLLTEQGTGRGSDLRNVTIRAWVVLILVATVCLNATIAVCIPVLNALYGASLPLITVDPTLANLTGVACGYYFTRVNRDQTEERKRQELETVKSAIRSTQEES